MYIFYGTLAARPVAGVLNRYYWATDIYVLFRDTGAAWEVVPAFYKKFIHTLFYTSPSGGTSVTATVNRVYMMPFEVTHTLSVDQILIGILTQNGNMRAAIYRDNGGTPSGGAIIIQSGVTAVGPANEATALALAATRLTPGLHWIAIQFDNAVAQFVRFDWRLPLTFGNPLYGYNYDAAGWGFDDPCPPPGIGASNDSPIGSIRVASIP